MSEAKSLGVSRELGRMWSPALLGRAAGPRRMAPSAGDPFRRRQRRPHPRLNSISDLLCGMAESWLEEGLKPLSSGQALA